MSENEDRTTRINKLRTSNTELNRRTLEHNAGPIVKKIDNLVRLLQDNKGHIGAIGLILLPTEGDSLVDMDEDRACDGVASIVAESEPGYALLEHHWKTSFKKQHGLAQQRTNMMLRGMPTGLAELLGGLGMGREEPSDGDDE